MLRDMRERLCVWGSIGLLIAGCSGGASEPPPTIAPEVPTTPAVTTTSEPAAPTPPPTNEPAPVALSAIDRLAAQTIPAEGAPDTRPEVTQLEVTTRTILDERWTVPRIAHPDEIVRGAIDQRIRALITAMEGRDAGGGECWAPLAHPRLVTIACFGAREGNRGGDDSFLETLHLRIEGTEVSTYDPSTAFVPEAPVAARLAASVDPEGDGDWCCRQWVIGAYGVYQWTSPGAPEAEVTYASIASFVRADGPLAPLIEEMTAVSPDPSENVPAPTRHGWAFGRSRAPAVLIAEWMRLEDDERAQVLVHVGRDDLGRLVTRSDRARLLATTLGADSGEEVPTRVALTGSEAILAARASVDVDAHAAPSPGSDVTAPILRGSDVWVIEGSIGRHASHASQGWAFVVSDDVRSGWVSSRSLTTSPRCHDFAMSIPAFPSARAGDTSVEGPRGIVTVRAREGLELAFTTRVGDTQSALDLATIDTACATGTRLASVVVDGDLVRVAAIGHGSSEGPLALVLVTASVQEDRIAGTERWSIFAPGARTPSWSTELPSGAALAADQRVRVTIDDTSHLQIRWPDGREGSARWDGTQILLSPPGIDLAAAGIGSGGGTAQAIDGPAADPNENATP
jgi:hypothetical protein